MSISDPAWKLFGPEEFEDEVLVEEWEDYLDSLPKDEDGEFIDEPMNYDEFVQDFNNQSLGYCDD